MPVMWYVKDGPRPNSQQGLGVPISFGEIKAALRAHKAHFLSTEPPQFNVGSPSQNPLYAVVEVRDSDGTDGQFAKPGFYLLPDLSPEEAQNRLDAYRNKK